MAKYMTYRDGRLAVGLGRLTFMTGKSFYVLVATRLDSQMADEKVILTDPAGKVLKWTSKKDARAYATSHNMGIYDSLISVMGGRTDR